MPTLKMEGPYQFDLKTIDEKVNRVSAGNFVLGRKDENGIFLFNYIGRALTDLNLKLKSWIDKSDTPLFKFSYSVSAEDAFDSLCENYHDFVKDRKSKHPRRPAHTDWKCPRCNFYE